MNCNNCWAGNWCYTRTVDHNDKKTHMENQCTYFYERKEKLCQKA